MRLSFYLPIITLAATSCFRSVAAMPAPDMRVPVPVSRLVANTTKYIKRHPKDARGYYILARVHSIAFSRSVLQSAPTISIIRGTDPIREEVDLPQRTIKAVDNSDRMLPDVGWNEFYFHDNTNRSPSSEELYNLREAVRLYAKATALAPQEQYYQLGYAWMLEQGIPYATRLGSPWAPPSSPPRNSTRLEWTQRAKAIYQRIYDQELKGYKFEQYNGALIEAAEGLLRLQTGPLTPNQIKQRQRIQVTLEKGKKASMVISPIILPLGKSHNLNDLLSPKVSVSFDISGDGLGRRWPWVGTETGILVWDPKHEGHITSGRQLFGSVTWWVFWKNGYQALEALDNDGDGSLSGAELEGIAIWRDANANGISDTGEVKPVKEWGIVALSTQSKQRIQGMPANLQGATTASGATLPTYDWMPHSLK